MNRKWGCKEDVKCRYPIFTTRYALLKRIWRMRLTTVST